MIYPSDSSLTPQRGTDPVDAFLPPPQESLLLDQAISSLKPQRHTTLLDPALFPKAPHQTPLPTFLPESVLPPHGPSSQVTILPERSAEGYPSPQVGTSILKAGLLPALPTPKLPNLVRPMPRKS